MKELKYRTRGKSSPYQKLNIYFTSHPQNHEQYLNLFSEEILRRYNCTIWYSDDAQRMENPEHLFNLEQMNLLVIPVTEMLLRQENIAVQEYFYAVENGVPVLPIVVEENVDQFYIPIFGETQYLDRTSTDATAISYDQKLDRALAHILIGDEEIEKIRKAFDVHIFLSYRKKDREYAQKLMRLIHQNDFCRDVAIWYDEFLNASESFTKQIFTVLANSDFFALAVTPNLFEDGNFVLTEELPAAKTAGKKIIPYELLDTQKERSEVIKGDSKNIAQRDLCQIIECDGVDCEDQEAIARSLECIQSISLEKAKTDYSHNFFVGLAYLYGIEVEKNDVLARNLITEAAESGLPEAIEKLASMYRYGEAVGRDYNVSIQWQIKLTEKLKLLSQNDDNYDEWLFSALIELVLYLQEVLRKEEANQFAKELCQIAQKLTNRKHNSTYVMLSHYYLADNTYGSEQERQKAFLNCCKLCENQYLSAKTLAEKQAALQILIQSYGVLGGIEYNRKHLSVSREFVEKGVFYCEKLLEMKNSIVYSQLLSIMLSRLCFVELQLNRYKSAKKQIEKAIEIGKQLYEEHLTDVLLRNIGCFYMLLGDVCFYSGEKNKAEEAYQKAKPYCIEYYEKTGNYLSKLNLCTLYFSIAELYIQQKPYKAERYYSEMDKITTSMENEYVTVDIAMYRVMAFVGLGICAHIQNDSVKERERFTNAHQYAIDVGLYENNTMSLMPSVNKLIYGYAIKCNLKELQEEYGKEFENTSKALIKEIRNMFRFMMSKRSLSSMNSLKMLWGTNLISGFSVTPVTTYIDIAADAVVWGFEDEVKKKTYTLEWLRDNIYFWRVPFYPILSLLLLFVEHVVLGYSDFPNSFCCNNCMSYQMMFQTITSMMIAVWLAMATKLKVKKLPTRLICMFMTVACGCIFAFVLAEHWWQLIPNTDHILFLLFPCITATLSAIVTKVVRYFLVQVARR